MCESDAEQHSTEVSSPEVRVYLRKRNRDRWYGICAIYSATAHDMMHLAVFDTTAIGEHVGHGRPGHLRMADCIEADVL